MAKHSAIALPQSGARSGLFAVPIILIVAMLNPAIFELGPLLLTPLRLFCMIIVVWFGFTWIRGGFGKLLPPDYAMMVFLVWMTASMGKHHPSAVVTFAGSNVALILGGYLAGRAAIRSVADFQAMAKLMAISAIVLIPFGLMEAVGQMDSPILDFYRSLPGIRSYGDADYCCRFGLNRAQTAFTHPIHYGVFASLAFSVFFFGLTNHVSAPVRMFVAALVAISAFLSVSSGAILVIGFQGLLILYAMMFHNQPWQWKAATWGAVGGYAVLEMMTSKVAFIALAGRLAFDPGNVWLREVIYDKGVDQIAKTPLLGIGANRLPGLPWWMTGSLDNHWLALAVMYGLPTFLACFTIFVWPILTAGRQKFRKGSDLYYARMSWSFLLIGLTLSMSTVYIWESVQCAVFFMVGAGMFLYYQKEPEDTGTAQQAAEEIAPRRSRYTRFNGPRNPTPDRPRGPTSGPVYTRKRPTVTAT